MKNRKEYNDRWNAPLVNPGFTLAEYEAKRKQFSAEDTALISAFEHALDVHGDTSHFAKVQARSEAAKARA